MTVDFNICQLVFIKPCSHPSGFYWGHQCSWTLTRVNSMKISIIQSSSLFVYFQSAVPSLVWQLMIMMYRHLGKQMLVGRASLSRLIIQFTDCPPQKWRHSPTDKHNKHCPDIIDPVNRTPPSCSVFVTGDSLVPFLVQTVAKQ